MNKCKHLKFKIHYLFRDQISCYRGTIKIIHGIELENYESGSGSSFA